MITQSISGAWQMRDTQSNKWLPATVPGGTYTDLLAAGQIPDPFVGKNEKQVQWVADRDWEYCHEFSVEPGLLEQDRVELVCTGLDTLAEITLNGQPVGQTNNMFRTYRWDIKSQLASGTNTLTVIFRSPLAYINGRQGAQAADSDECRHGSSTQGAKSFRLGLGSAPAHQRHLARY